MKLILLVIVAVLVLSYFHVDLRTFVSTKAGWLPEKLKAVWSFLETIWREFLFFFDRIRNLLSFVDKRLVG